MIYIIIVPRIVTETSIKLVFSERTLDLYIFSGLTSEHKVTRMPSKFSAAALAYMMKPSASSTMTAEVNRSRPAREVSGVFKMEDKKRPRIATLECKHHA